MAGKWTLFEDVFPSYGCHSGQPILVYGRVTHSIPPFVEIKVDVQNACLGEHARHNEKREMDGGWTLWTEVMIWMIFLGTRFHSISLLGNILINPIKILEPKAVLGKRCSF